MYNKVVMVGNLTRDVELRYLPSGAAVARSAIATSFKYKTQTGEQKDEVCFIDFNMFGRSAEVANQYLKKGSKVLLEGRLVFEQWVDQQGQNRNRHSLRVDTMKMLDNKSDSSSYQNDGGYSNSSNGNAGEYYQNEYSQQAPQKQYNQPQNNSYGNGGYNQPQANGGISSSSMQQENHKIPEIDIDDEIPF